MFIASLAATCVFLISNKTASQLASAIAILFILVSVLTFAVLTIVRDLISEQHLGIKRLVTVLAVLSGVVIPALYWALSYLTTEGGFSSPRPYYDFDAVLFWALVVLSPPCVAALLLYGARLNLWIREGFNASK
jgi:hypothetical protein